MSRIAWITSSTREPTPNMKSATGNLAAPTSDWKYSSSGNETPPDGAAQPQRDKGAEAACHEIDEARQAACSAWTLADPNEGKRAL